MDRHNRFYKSTRMYATISVAVAALFVGYVFPRTAQASPTWAAKQVGMISAPDWRNCLYFTLVGVTEADPAVPGIVYFAVDKAQNGYSEIYSLLLWAKATNSPMTVVTTSAPAGGNCSAQGNIVGVANVFTTQ